MSAPSLPTADTIVIEGCSKANAETDVARAKGEWLEEIKNDIWSMVKKLTSLQTEYIAITVKGRARYALPSDFSSHIGMTLLDGSETGTAQAGASGTITLQSNETFTENWIQGKDVVITAGTGVNQKAQVTAYNSTTKVATISPSWTTVPVSGDTYLIVDKQYELVETPLWEYDRQYDIHNLDRPSHYTLMGDATNGQYFLYKTPDKIYGLKIRYYADLMELDLAGTLITTLYQKWRNVFIQGIYAKALQNNNDIKTDAAMKDYHGLIRLLIMREQYGMDLSNMQITIKE